MKYKVDYVRIRENYITLNGWVVGKKPDSQPSFHVYNSKMENIDFKYVKTRRDDVSQVYFGKVYDEEYGFDIRFDYIRGEDYYLEIVVDNKKKKIKYNEELIYKRSSVAYKRMEKLKDLCNMETVRVVFSFLKKHGLMALVRKSKSKIQGMDNDYEYTEWYEKTRPAKQELAAQRETSFKYSPLFSVVIPLYATPDNFLRELLDSIFTQTYNNFEICLADGSESGRDKQKFIENYIEEKNISNKIKYKKIGSNLGIAGNTNEALNMAVGDYIVLADHDDVITENALYECAKAINEQDCDCLYSDEDKLDMDGGSLFDPHFKPDFNIDLLESVNYICHLFVVKKDLVDKAGMFDERYDGAQDYDFIFRVTEKAKKIYHIQKVLYHWRCHMNSTASNPQSKLYAFEAGAKAIKAHIERMGNSLPLEKIEKGVDYGIYHKYFIMKDKPLLSIIIPNKDHRDDLDLAIRSIMVKSTYKNIEFIVVENNSTDKKTFEYYEQIQKEFIDVKVVNWGREFNYSLINNYGVGFAKGEYLFFLNNDIELINKTSIEEMMWYAVRKDVGIVGARLLYNDDTIQHAGVVVGFGGIAGHTFIGLSEVENSYFHRALTLQDYSAVTAAALITKKSIFEEVGGFSEDLAVAFNDIDYCMKVRQKNYLVVYNPYALFYHYESKSRGLEDTPDRIERFNRETATFMKKWPDILKNGDPYYNPNLTLRKSNFALKDLLNEKIGEPFVDEKIKKYL